MHRCNQHKTRPLGKKNTPPPDERRTVGLHRQVPLLCASGCISSATGLLSTDLVDIPPAAQTDHNCGLFAACVTSVSCSCCDVPVYWPMCVARVEVVLHTGTRYCDMIQPAPRRAGKSNVGLFMLSLRRGAQGCDSNRYHLATPALPFSRIRPRHTIATMRRVCVQVDVNNTQTVRLCGCRPVHPYHSRAHVPPLFTDGLALAELSLKVYRLVQV